MTDILTEIINSCNKETSNEALASTAQSPSFPEEMKENRGNVEEDDDEEIDFIELNNDLQQDAFMKEILMEKELNINNSISQLQSELAVLEENFVSTLSGGYSGPLAKLHFQISDVDQLLEKMESILNGFQLDLSKLSTEIEHIQSQSSEMAYRLKNRVSVQMQLKSILDGILITPTMIRAIFEKDPGDKDFVETIVQLNEKLHFLRTSSGKQLKALKDVATAFEALRIKAIEKIRTYLMDKVKSLALANANVSIIQKTCFLKNQALYHFLFYRSPDIADEIRNNYSQIMANYYFQRFSRYLARMLKLQNVIADKNDLIGVEDSSKKTVGLFGTSKLNPLKDKSSVYTLGERIETLMTIQEAPVILPHVAEEQQIKYSYECILRSIIRTLMDNSCSEYVFALEFFSAPPLKNEQRSKHSAAATATEMFNEIFVKTIKMIYDSVKATTDSGLDAVGLLLCIRITMKHQMMMQTRKIPCLDQLLNSLILLFWPRFQNVIDLHITSVKQRSNASGGGFFGHSIDVHPHYVTRRYGEFSCSILTLNDGYNDNLLETSILRLRNEVEALLVKMSNEIHDDAKKLIFLINNYDLIISIYDAVKVATVDKEKANFQVKLDEKIVEYVESQILTKFGQLVGFVSDLEKSASADSSTAALANASQAKFESIAHSFNDNWRMTLSDINTVTMQSFTNFRNGSVVLQTAMKEIIFYYQKFILLWEKKFGHSLKSTVQPVSLHEVVMEIKSMTVAQSCTLEKPVSSKLKQPVSVSNALRKNEFPVKSTGLKRKALSSAEESSSVPTANKVQRTKATAFASTSSAANSTVPSVTTRRMNANSKSTGGATKTNSKITTRAIATSTSKVATKENVSSSTLNVKKKRPAWDTKGRLEDLEEVLRANSAEIKEKDEIIRKLEADINELDEKHSEQIEKLQGEHEAHAKDLESSLKSAQDSVESLTKRVESLDIETAALKSTVSIKTATIIEQESNVAQLEIRLKSSEETSSAKSVKIEELEESLRKSQETIDDLESKLREEELMRRRLHNTIQELKGNIRVFCRVRPPLAQELQDKPTDEFLSHLEFSGKDNKEIVLKMSSESADGMKTVPKLYEFSFDKVFQPNSSQSEVFEEISQLVQSACDGYNVCLFAYGQTGSGKTYTMEGPSGSFDDEKSKGMITRAVLQIWEETERLKCKGWAYLMEGSFVEIYNETIRDLLAEDAVAEASKKHDIKHLPGGKTVVTDAVVSQLSSATQVIELLKQAAKNRKVAETDCNERSSRSHSVFMLRISGENELTGEKCSGMLNLIDLAGSERLAQSGSTGDRLKETQAINKSLSALGDVISALGNKDSHIPYRNSKLTYLLQNSLGGNSKTLMFVNVSPSETSFNETLCSLRFATKVNNCQIGTARKLVK